MAAKNTTISACLIVKNEEKQLPACLESLNNMVDEIIIVDTGSTDRTIEIARGFAAKVHEHAWESDFSKHRNQAVKYASGDWLLNIDADERLIPGKGINKAKFHATLSRISQGCNGIMLPMRDINQMGDIVSEYMNVRLVRNTADFHYEGIVHENPIFKGTPATINEITLNHHGYHLAQEEMDQKRKRNTDLLLKRAEENPRDIATYFYLANHYAFVLTNTPESLQKAAGYGRKCIQLLTPKPSTWPSAYLGLFRIIGETYYLLSDRKEAAKWGKKGLNVIPDDPDLHFLMCKIAIADLKYKQALEYGYAYLKVLDKYRRHPELARGRLLSAVSRDSELAVQYRILVAYLGLGEKIKAEEQWPLVKDVVLSNNQMKFEYLRNLAVAADADRLLERSIAFYALSSPRDRSLLNPLIDHAASAETVEKTFTELLAGLSEGESLSELSCYIADRLIKKRRFEQAVTFLQPLYDRDVDNGQISTLLALASERVGQNELAREIYNGHLQDVDIGSDFIINAMNYYKNSNDQNGLQAAVSILMQRHEHKDLDDDILLFLIDFYWTSARYDDFLAATMELLPRHVPQLPEKFQDNVQIAEGYSTLSTWLVEQERYNQAMQVLHIAWTISGDAKYLYLLGNLFADADQTVVALQYYQEALNRDYITLEILDRMQDAHLKVGNDSGAVICLKLREKLFAKHYAVSPPLTAECTPNLDGDAQVWTADYFRKVRDLHHLEIILGRKIVTTYPTFLVYLMSDVCNSHCFMCGYHGVIVPPQIKKRGQQKSLFFEKALTSTIWAAVHADSIMMAGDGEPLLNPGLGSFLETLKSNANIFHQPEINIVTNGQLLNKLNPEFISFFKQISVSFDSPDKETFELLRFGTKFDLVVNNIRTIKHLRPETNIAFNVAVSQCNIYALPELVDLAASLGVSEMFLWPLNASYSLVRAIQLRKEEKAAYQMVLDSVVSRQDVKVSNKINLESVVIDVEKRSHSELLSHIRNVCSTWKHAKRELLRCGKVNQPDESISTVQIANQFGCASSSATFCMETAIEPCAHNMYVSPNLIDDYLKQAVTELKHLGSSWNMPWCLAPWTISVIQGDGRVRPCCPMILHQGSLPPVAGSDIGAAGSYEKAWNSNELMMLREAMYDSAKLPMQCRTCTNSQKDYYKDAIESTAQRYDLLDVVLSNDQVKIEYLRKLAVAADVDRLFKRTVAFYVLSSPRDNSLLNPLIDYAVSAETVEKTFTELLAGLSADQSTAELGCYIADRLIKKERYEQAAAFLQPLYESDVVNGQISTLLALAYEKTGKNELAREIYNCHLRDADIGSGFIINAMNYYKNNNDLNGLQTAVSIFMERYEHKELEDDVLLFLIEFYWTSARYGDFLAATMELLPRHLPQLPEKFQDNIQIAEGYGALCASFREKERHNQAMQALHIAWSISGDGKYLYMLGNLLADADQAVLALQYYQEALNRDYITPEILDRMEAAHLLIGNESGAVICRKLKEKLLSKYGN